jgi:hypothetical protein
LNPIQEIAIAKKVNKQLIELIFLQENKTLTLDEVKYGWDLAYQLDSTKNSCVLLKTGEWTLLDREAGQFVFNEMKQWSAVAILVHNSAQKILGSVAIGVIGQTNKLKLFGKETDAIHWLESKMKLV